MKKAIGLVVAVMGLVAFLATPSTAAVIDLEGDLDCFGLGGSCPDGTRWRDDLGGVFFTSNQGPGDPAFTDIWDSPASVSYTHTYASGPALSATLELRIAGIHDVNTGTVYNVLFNGTSIGIIPVHVGANNFQEVLTYAFVVPVGLLTGADLVTFNAGGGDGFSIDFSRLAIETAVPEPVSLLLLGGGLLTVALRRRKAARQQ